MDGRRLERLVEAQRRQHAAQSPREHRLPRTRRADEQEVVAARRGNLQRPAGQELAADVRKVQRRPLPVAAAAGGGTLAREGSCKRADGIHETAHGQHAKP